MQPDRETIRHETIRHETIRHEPIRIETDKARAGETPHVVRYVLAFSMAGAIIAMLLSWLYMYH